MKTQLHDATQIISLVKRPPVITTDVTQLRLALHENRFRPVPVMTGEKRPILKDWGNVCAKASAETIRSWTDTEPGSMSTGILCGDIVAIDIDVLDDDLSNQVELLARETLGDTLLKRVGRFPKTLLVYTTAEPISKMATPEMFLPDGVKAQVEILAKGQQFVAFGKHPDTQGKYVWTDRSPLDIPTSELPLITREQCANLLKQAEELLGKAGALSSADRKKYESQGRKAAGLGLSEIPSRAKIEEALSYIPNSDTGYRDWISIGFALHSWGGDGAQSLWESWSGQHQKNDPVETANKWGSFATGRSGITIGTLLWTAQQNGWRMESKHSTLSAPETDHATPDETEWPEPKPIYAPLFPVPEFDPEPLLPKVLRDWVIDEADRMPCPVDFIAMGVMVSLGSIIGARCAIKPKSRDSWLIVPNLWGGIVALPSAKKSPAISAALKHLDRLIARAMETYLEKVKDFEAEKILFDAKEEAIVARLKAAAKDAAKGDPDKIVKELQEHREREPKSPILRRYKTNDATIEKLGELLQDNPNGLLMLRDEIVGLLVSWDKQGHEGDRAFFLESWNGDSSFDTDRIKRGSIFIPNLCASIFGGIQPDKLIGYLEQAANSLANDGMLQRFQLLVYPNHQEWEWRDRIPNKEARDAVFKVFEALASFNPVAWGAAPADVFAKFPSFRFDDAAQQIFIEWSADLHLNRLPGEDHPLIQQHLAKYDKLFPALALIFHLVDCAATGRGGPVTAEAALRAAAWCEYLEDHARRCYGLLADDGLRAAQALVEKLLKRKLSDGFTARDVRRNQWRYLTTDEAVRAALDWLEDEGWLRGDEIGGTGAGRPTKRYFISPKIAKFDKKAKADQPESDNDELA